MLRVRAVDRKKRLSPVKVVRVVVDPPAAPITAHAVWQVHVNLN